MEFQRGSDEPTNKWEVLAKDDAHQAWIWNMTIDTDHSFYTTSWDSTLKKWNLGEAAITEQNCINLGTAVHCVALTNRNEILATTFGKKLCIVDPRTFTISAEHNFHKRAVIGLAVHGDMIYTTGEDKLLMMVDRRMMNKIFRYHYTNHGYIPCVSYKTGQLLCATSKGYVDLHDAESLNVIHSYKVGVYTRQVMADDGAQLVLHKSQSFQFSAYNPGLHNSIINLSNVFEIEPSKFDFSPSSEILVIGNGDSSLVFYGNAIE
ncbi:unnamed protein product [Caenorhabditis bovis]|uniref:Uncharacterized protein n=1 Tax=Caenorhabditis bovis TaxID=2654633 RepID=A0A8S1EZI1_9PELO|nr:unnamed protein product [Caenorhabditis bovis]